MDAEYPEGPNGNPRAVLVHFEKAVESDTSDVFSPVNFPSDQYKYVTVYYSLYNPSDKDVEYEFNVSIRDQANRYFYADEFILAEKVPAHGSLQNRVKHFAVYRNSTSLQLVWTDKEVNPPWDHYDTFIDLKFQDATPTPTPTPTPTSTPTPTPSNPAGQCMPFLPVGLIIGGVGGAGLLINRHNKRR
ncbi:hypothetical protein [Methanocella conradii]|uniref:hypothetical protein n=1 Tax=Methanocella conradii TaxID=1175444 RepID=UPI0020C6B5DD|nr:hypothetical protein [Methanocella conradii]